MKIIKNRLVCWMLAIASIPYMILLIIYGRLAGKPPEWFEDV